MRNVLFEYLPPKRRRRADDDGDFYDDADRQFREILFYEPEGPLPVRHRRGGFSSLPHPLVLPEVTGVGAVGDTLSCSTGTWTNTPTAYAYQWLHDGVPLAGMTTSLYLVAPTDSGHSLSCAVTATAAGGSGSATSNAVLIA